MPLSATSPIGLPAVPYGPLVTFNASQVGPPSGVYVAADDQVIVAMRSPSVISTLTASARLLTPAGLIVTTPLMLTQQTSGSAYFTAKLEQTEGFILSVTVFGAAASRGQCFCKVYIQRSPSGGAGVVSHLLVQDYVTADDYLGYPQSPCSSSLEGRGWLHQVVVASPVAGSDWLLTVPAGVRWRLKHVVAILVASAAASNRIPVLRIGLAAASNLVDMPAPSTITASQNVVLTWGEGLVSASVAGNQVQSLPAETILLPGGTIGTSTAGLLAGDQWSGIGVNVEEWVSQ